MARLTKPASNVPLLGDAKVMWASSLKAANKADKTIRTYIDAVGKLEAQVTSLRPIDRITRSDHEAMIAGLYAQGWKPSSVSTVYRSLRSFWKFVVGHDDLPVDKDPMNGMTAPVIPETTVQFLT